MVRNSVFSSVLSCLKPSYIRNRSLRLNGSRFSSNSSNEPPGRLTLQDDADARIEKFLDPEVQKSLKDLTGLEYARVFRSRKLGAALEEPKYSFMTETQLKQALEEANARAEKILQMPPVLPVRKPIDVVLSKNPEVVGWDGSRPGTLVFADITMGIPERQRIIVARDRDGTLRQASWEERDKMNRIYNPIPGREVKTPKMFLDMGLLKDVLERTTPEDNTYEFVLDRACHQMEPDDPIYVRTVEFTYDTVNNKRHYEYLRSTRHYGPMLFYLIRHRKFDNLLISLLNEERLQEAAHVVRVFALIFPESKSAQKITSVPKDEDSAVAALEHYIDSDSVLKAEVRINLNAYLERQKDAQKLEAGLREAHGM